MNAHLLSEFIVEEISRALNQMQPFKAPGLMGSQWIFTNIIGQQLVGRYAMQSIVFSIMDSWTRR
jgi:hypothetical protein